MFRSLLPEIQGIAMMQIVAMLIFVAVFAGVIYLVINMNRSHIKHMKHLPLDLEDDPSLKHGEGSHG